MDIDPLAVAIAAIAALVLSGAWYAVVSAEPENGAEPPQPGPSMLLGELVRNAVLSIVVAGLAAEIAVGSVGGGVLLGLVLFVGFPVVLFSGAMIHEGYPGRLALAHLGDWLLKLVLIGALVGAIQ